VNERIEGLVDGSVAAPDQDRIGFMCECGDGECETTIYLSRREYEEVRRDPAQLAIVRGHDIPSAERVLDRREGYDIVEKIGAARDQVLKEDPRA
jgi:hypothetical protein